MTPEDTTPAPVKLADPSTVHPLSAHLLNLPKDTGPRWRTEAALPKDDPTVASGVQELEALFAPSLTPTEVAFHAQQMTAAATAASAARVSRAPTNFLQAHMIIIEQLLMNPSISQTELSGATGYSRNWLHKVMSSDAFQAKLAERQKALIDPIIFNTIQQRLQGLTSRSLEVMEQRMESDEVSLDTALTVFGATSKAMGLGANKTPVVAQQFIVHVPPRMSSATEWAALHSGRPAETTSEPLDITPAPESPAP